MFQQLEFLLFPSFVQFQSLHFSFYTTTIATISPEVPSLVNNICRHLSRFQMSLIKQLFQVP